MSHYLHVFRIKAAVSFRTDVLSTLCSALEVTRSSKRSVFILPTAFSLTQALRVEVGKSPAGGHVLPSSSSCWSDAVTSSPVTCRHGMTSVCFPSRKKTPGSPAQCGIWQTPFTMWRRRAQLCFHNKHWEAFCVLLSHRFSSLQSLTAAVVLKKKKKSNFMRIYFKAKTLISVSVVKFWHFLLYTSIRSCLKKDSLVCFPSSLFVDTTHILLISNGWLNSQSCSTGENLPAPTRLT